MCTSALVLLSLLAQISPPVANPQAKARAQVLLTEGSALYEKGDYAAALEKFNAAYAAYPSPKLMFNIGQADRDLSRPVEALEAFEKFLASNTGASPETIADASKSVAELREKLGRIRIDCDTPGAEVNVDGKSVGLTPLPDLVWATPGRHHITASHENTIPALENVDVTAGSVGTVTLRLRPLAIPVAAEPVPEPVAVPPPSPPNPALGASPAQPPRTSTWGPARRQAAPARVGGWAGSGHGLPPVRRCCWRRAPSPPAWRCSPGSTVWTSHVAAAPKAALLAARVTSARFVRARSRPTYFGVWLAPPP